jgi:hypothetical protein
MKRRSRRWIGRTRKELKRGLLVGTWEGYAKASWGAVIFRTAMTPAFLLWRSRAAQFAQHAMTTSVWGATVIHAALKETYDAWRKAYTST